MVSARVYFGPAPASQTHEDLRARHGANQPETRRPEHDMTVARFADDIKIWK